MDIKGTRVLGSLNHARRCVVTETRSLYWITKLLTIVVQLMKILLSNRTCSCKRAPQEHVEAERGNRKAIGKMLLTLWNYEVNADI